MIKFDKKFQTEDRLRTRLASIKKNSSSLVGKGSELVLLFLFLLSAGAVGREEGVRGAQREEERQSQTHRIFPYYTYNLSFYKLLVLYKNL